MDKPISNREAEQGVLAAVIRNPAQYKPLADILQPDSFSWECFSWCWEAFAKLEERGLRLDAITLADELERAGRLAGFQLPELKQFTGRAAVSQLRDVETTEAATSYAINVQDYAAKRKLDEWFTQYHNQAHNGRKASEIVTDFQTDLSTLVLHSGKTLAHTVNMEVGTAKAEEASKIASRGERAATTGLPDLDKLVSPKKSELIVIGARPGQGKTGFLGDIAIANARLGKRVLSFTTESSDVIVVQRMISKLSGIAADRIMDGKLTEEEWERFHVASAELRELPITVCDLSDLKIGQIRTESRRNPYDLILLDYIQLTNSDTKKDRRDLDIGEVTGGLIGLAKELDIVVFAAAQLGRQAEGREPVLADLRESGSIEQDARTVIFIYRTEASSEMIVSKHNNGACGKVPVYFHPTTISYSSGTYNNISEKISARTPYADN